MTDHDLQEFGTRLGLPGLSLSDDGSISLGIGELGTLTLQRTGVGMLMSLSVPEDFFDAQRMRSLLRECAWQQAGSFPLSAGYFSGRFVAAVRCSGFSAAEAENALRFLIDTMHNGR